MKRSEAKRSCLEQSLSPLPVANPSRSGAWVHVPAWPGWRGGGFVCCIKPICVLSGGGAAAAPWRGSSSHCQTQPPPTPGSPDLGQLLSLKRTLTPVGRPGQEERWGDLRNNHYQHQKEVDSREREGRGRELHDPVGRGAQGLPSCPTNG